MEGREGFLEAVTFISNDESFWDKQAVTDASACKFLKWVCEVVLILSSHCGQYAKSYKKIKWRSPVFLSMKSKLHGRDQKRWKGNVWPEHSYSARWNTSVSSERKLEYIFSSYAWYRRRDKCWFSFISSFNSYNLTCAGCPSVRWVQTRTLSLRVAGNLPDGLWVAGGVGTTSQQFCFDKEQRILFHKNC